MNSEYWNKRCEQFGHTGWANQLVYQYDQPLRVRVLKELIESFTCGRTSALDYGCGTGDFSVMLSNLFSQVTATDLSDQSLKLASKKNARNSISYVPLSDKVFSDKKYDLILCVTVLQHILDDKELDQLLSKFRATLNPNGVLFVLESFAKPKANSTGYIHQRSKEAFLEQMKKMNFALVNDYSFYHPQKMPTFLFLVYFALALVLKPFKGITKKLSQILLRFDSGIIKSESPTRILVFK